MATACLIGRNGFIGGALARRLGKVSPMPTDDTKTLFYLAGHVHPVFETNPDFEMRRTLNDFSYMLPYCKERGILFVYTSSALVYERNTQFSEFKRMLECMALSSGASTLGLRIFPTYGPGEDRTVISQWCSAMAVGDRPVVFGDGTQTRDFIFIEDVVDQILTLANDPNRPHVADIGTGVRTSFNRVIEDINQELDRNIKPRYIAAPPNYSEGIVCKTPLPHRFSIPMGIERILETIHNDNRELSAIS